ncbi:MAG: single-stranded-DNA-specific exonuclease RecJ [Bdellovibrionota bacterium]
MISGVEPRQWRLRYESPCELVETLKRETGLPELVIKVCIARGLQTSEAIHGFLNPRFDSLTNPMTIKDMDRAVERLIAARRTGELVRVFADYDVDGTAGAALLSWVFKEYGIKFDVRQPDRFKDGYGLNVGAVEEALAENVSVMLTVDCGISSFAAAAAATKQSLDLIIVDHHQIDPERGLPEALAVVNPQRDDCPSGLKQICGCGLAFYLAMALRMRGRQEGWFRPGLEPNLKKHLDLVVIATAADMVPLTGDNHVLVRHGLEVLRRSMKPGVQSLLDAAGLNRDNLSPSHLGFVIGPRINASGRMKSASTAFELLSTEDILRARELARELEKLNVERAEFQNRIWDEVRLLVEREISAGGFQHAVVVAGNSWHEGVIGIVAARVCETFHRPAIVIAMKGDIGKGSVRTYGGKDVFSALRSCSDLLLGFGGHKHAAGLSISVKAVPAFTEAFDSAIVCATNDGDVDSLLIEDECSIADFSLETLGELEKLGPFGQGNPEPVFAFRAGISNHHVLKGRHVKMSFNDRGDHGDQIDAIWFNAAERHDVKDFFASFSSSSFSSGAGGFAQWAGVPELNRFRGKTVPTVRIKDWKRTSL